MAAQSLAVGQRYAHVFAWRGLLLLRTMGIGVAAGLVAGFVAGGIGARLVMKVVALTAGPAARRDASPERQHLGAFTADDHLPALLRAALGMIWRAARYGAAAPGLRKPVGAGGVWPSARSCWRPVGR